MTAGFPRRRLCNDCQGTTAVEFAVIASVLFPMLFGILGLGFQMWTYNALQTTAALTARCVGIGSSLCSANPAQFAVNKAQQWTVPGISSTLQVTIPNTPTNPVSSCNGVAGSFVTVEITSSYWASNVMPWPFARPTLQVSACFPVPAG
jgi:Flp pilus assembly protein TadG